MFKFPIFYYPDGDQGGGQEENEEYGEERESQEQSQDQQDSQDTDSGGDTTTQGTAVDYDTDTEIQSDTPETRGKEIQGEGEKYLKVKEYVGTKSQHTRNLIFGAPPPTGLPKHIQVVAGPAPDSSLVGPKLRVTVNKFVTSEDQNTGTITIDPGFDSVQSIQDITPNNAGAPYFTDTGQGNDVIDMYGLGTQSFLSYQTGSEEYISANTTTTQLYIEYENDHVGGGSCTTLPYCPFQRRIQVTWASGEFRNFEVILPGWSHATLSGTGSSPSHTTFTRSVRADGCEGDGTSGHTHTSHSQNNIGYTGNQHNDYAYLGFFKTVQGNNVGLPNSFEYNASWNTTKFYDFDYEIRFGLIISELSLLKSLV